ncbi:MAG: nucleotidyltransferase family protein [Patescibacteria group bacterium]
MTSKDVIGFYNQMEDLGIKIWVDGGWSVDALLEKETRPHNDLDIALEWKDASKLREALETQGYKQIKENSKWNFVLADAKGHEIDVHAFVYDNKGNIIDGIMYPAESLTGTGVIDGKTVRCISPKYQVQFLAPWIHKWPEKYLPAVGTLCEKFGIDLPKEYQDYKN